MRTMQVHFTQLKCRYSFQLGLHLYQFTNDIKRIHNPVTLKWVWSTRLKFLAVVSIFTLGLSYLPLSKSVLNKCIFLCRSQSATYPGSTTSKKPVPHYMPHTEHLPFFLLQVSVCMQQVFSPVLSPMQNASGQSADWNSSNKNQVTVAKMQQIKWSLSLTLLPFTAHQQYCSWIPSTLWRWVATIISFLAPISWDKSLILIANKPW